MDGNRYNRYIFQIVATGSLTKAAESLGISQPALSLGLNKLERELGFKIFNRQTMPLCFTEEGRIYYDYIQRTKILQKDFALRISALQKEKNNKVIIGGPEVYIGGIVTTAVKRLSSIHPYFSIGLKSASMSQLIDLASNHEINCFISTTDELPTNFVQLPIKKEKIYLCISKKNPINSALMNYEINEGNSEKLMDFSCLKNEEFVFLEEWQPMQKKLRELTALYGFKPFNRIVVNQVSTLLNMTLACEGMCIAAEDALTCNGNTDQFCLYSLPHTVSDRLIYVAYDKDLYLTEAAQKLIKVLKEVGGFTK